MKKIIVNLFVSLIFIINSNIIVNAEYISSDIAKIYLKEINNECNGNIGSFKRDGIIAQFSGNGLFNAKLLDFNNDGIDELIFLKLKESNSNQGIFKVYIYSFVNNEIINITKNLSKELLIYANYNINNSINLYYENNKTYLINNYDSGFSNILEIYEINNSNLNLLQSYKKDLVFNEITKTYDIVYCKTTNNEIYNLISENEYNYYIEEYINNKTKSSVFWENKYLNNTVKFGADNVNLEVFLNKLKNISENIN